MGNLMPYNDDIIANAPCLLPTNFDYDKWMLLANKFQKKWPFKMVQFSKDLDRFDMDITGLLEKFNAMVISNKTIVDFYLDSSVQLKYPYVSLVAGTVLALPPTSAEVERIFSRLNLTKTVKRTRLSDDTLQSLMLLNTTKIKLDDPEIYPKIIKNIQKCWKNRHLANSASKATHELHEEQTVAQEKKTLKRKIEDLVEKQENIHEKMELEEEILKKTPPRRLKKFADNNKTKSQNSQNNFILNEENYL